MAISEMTWPLFQNSPCAIKPFHMKSTMHEIKVHEMHACMK